MKAYPDFFVSVCEDRYADIHHDVDKYTKVDVEVKLSISAAKKNICFRAQGDYYKIPVLALAFCILENLAVKKLLKTKGLK